MDVLACNSANKPSFLNLTKSLFAERSIDGASYYNWSFVVVCLFRIYSAVYGPTDPILGREVGAFNMLRWQTQPGLFYKMTVSKYASESGLEPHWQGASWTKRLFVGFCKDGLLAELQAKMSKCFRILPFQHHSLSFMVTFMVTAGGPWTTQLSE